MARADGSLRGLLARLSRIDVLVINDWGMSLLSEPALRVFMRSARTATVVDGIFSQLVHNAHRIEMRWDSMRKGSGQAMRITPGKPLGSGIGKHYATTRLTAHRV
jgi:hypothetical protein